MRHASISRSNSGLLSPFRLAPLAALALAAQACATAAAQTQDDWRAAEAESLRAPTQLTFSRGFDRAGEAYFNADASWVIFQAAPAARGAKAPDEHYSMYVGALERDEAGRVTGLERLIRLSPEGSANTCGFFHPIYGHKVIFGSTLTPPAKREEAGYQRGESRYAWAFPEQMDVVQRSVPTIWRDEHPDRPAPMWAEDALRPVPLWREPGYDAECAYSPDGRFIVYTHVDPETEDADIWIRDAQSGERWPIVQAPGYDGGPFFSPDGQRLVYRSDREGNDLLQVYVADLAFDADGRPTGVAKEHALTANEHVNWAPFWHPSGEFIIYATSEVSHRNYEVFSIEAPPVGESVDPADLRRRRITHAPGFDGLPVFSPDGSLMMWTSQRAGVEAGEERPSSQIWIAEVVDLRP